MGCFSCGKTFSKDASDTVAKYKKEYLKNGIERYVYRLSPSSDLMIIRKEYFNEVFNNDIKPNLENGAEYMHISEYTGA